MTHADGSVTKVYDEAKLGSRDLYDIFLSGSEPLLTIENPDADTEKELVLFRDSFGSSLAPLLLQGYRKVTLVDIRYMDPKLLSNYVNFQNADVLFLYSTPGPQFQRCLAGVKGEIPRRGTGSPV